MLSNPRANDFDGGHDRGVGLFASKHAQHFSAPPPLFLDKKKRRAGGGCKTPAGGEGHGSVAGGGIYLARFTSIGENPKKTLGRVRVCQF